MFKYLSGFLGALLLVTGHALANIVSINELAVRYVQHEIDHNEFVSKEQLLAQALSNLIDNSEAFKNLTALGRQDIVFRLRAGAKDYHRPSIRAALLIDCLYQNSGLCKNEINRKLAPYITDTFGKTSLKTDFERFYKALEELWQTEAIVQSALRLLKSDQQNKLYFLELFWDIELVVPTNAPGYEAFDYAIFELGRTEFFDFEKESTRELSIRRWITIEDYLRSHINNETKYKSLLRLIGIQMRNNEYRDLRKLEPLFLRLLNLLDDIDAFDQYNTLAIVYEKYVDSWPFKTSSGEYLRKLENLALNCRPSKDNCKELIQLHKMHSATHRLYTGDYAGAESAVDTLVSELAKETTKGGSAEKLEILLKRILPLTVAIGSARAKGDLGEVIRGTEQLRPLIEFARNDQEFSKYYEIFGQYELLFIVDEFSIGRRQKAISDAERLLRWTERLPTNDLDRSAKDNLLINIEGFLHRAKNSAKALENQGDKTKKEIQKSAWNYGSSIVDKLRLFLYSYATNDKSAEIKEYFQELEEHYQQHIKDGSAIPRVSFEKFLSIFRPAVNSDGPAVRRLEANEELDAFLNLTVASIFGNVFSARAFSDDTAALAETFRGRANNLSIFFSKIFINSLHENLNNLDKKLGQDKHDFILPYEDFIKTFISEMVSRGDFQSAYSALTTLRNIQHANFVDRQIPVDQRISLLLDTQEARLNAELQTIFKEAQILSREFYKSLDRMRSNQILNRLHSLESQLLKEFLVFSKARTDKVKSRSRAFSKNHRKVVVAISSGSSVTEFFAQNGDKMGVFRLNLSQQALREAVFSDYQALVGKRTVDTEKFRTSSLISPAITSLLQQVSAKSDSEVSIFLDDTLYMLPDIALFDKVLLSKNSFVRVVDSGAGSNKINSVRSGAYFFGASVFNATGQNLPYVNAEEKGFRRAYQAVGVRNFSFIDSGFTSDRLRTALHREAEVIHIATHFSLVGNSLRSSRLSIGNGGSISGSEIFSGAGSLRGVSLVTLAACDTGISNEFSANARGFRGLGTELIKSGVGEVVASLWRISDKATSVFFRVFYEIKTTEKLNAANALRETQRIFSTIEKLSSRQVELLRRSLGSDYGQHLKEMSDPFYWAGFISYRQFSVN